MKFKLAILNVLAMHPHRRLTLEEIRREVRTLIANTDQTQLNRLYAFGDVDIFRSGLVSQDDVGWQITEAGLSLLRSLKNDSDTSLEASSLALASRQEPHSGDDLADSDERLRQFDLVDGPILPPPRIDVDGLRGSINAKARRPNRKSSALVAALIAFIAAKKSLLDVGRRYAASRTTRLVNTRNERLAGNFPSAAFGLLSLLSVVACVVAAIAFGQIGSLKSDIAALRREFLPVRDRITKLEQSDKTKRDEQDEEAQNKSDGGKNKSGAEISPVQTALNLSREEIQFIRDYIKPAPTPGGPAPDINVGDPVTGAMIPLPSQLTDKVPKLLGARFTTRNGTIIIVKRDSRQADAVLGPN